MESIAKRIAELGADEEALEEHFIRGSGRGGQKLNKTSSCVQLIYGELEVRCQKTRSQANRFWARRELCERILERREGAYSKRQQEMEKVRRQKAAVPAGEGEMLENERDEGIRNGCVNEWIRRINRTVGHMFFFGRFINFYKGGRVQGGQIFFNGFTNF